MKNKFLSGLLLAALAFLAAGCAGWSAGSLVRDGMERIYVPFFRNDTYYRGLEEHLTREVIARIDERTDLHLVDRQSAEMILEGRVTKYDKRVLSQDTQNRILESSATVTVQVRLIRAADGSVIDEKTYKDRAEFFTDLDETLETSQRESFKIISHKILSIVEKSF